MTYEYYLISRKNLPESFRYPKSFLHYLKYNETQEETSIYECWEERNLIRELGDGDMYIYFFYKRLKYDFPEKNFVPFARLYDDLIYCFDGNDSSGDPGIYIVKTFTENHHLNDYSFIIEYENFYEWLRNSIQEGIEKCACNRAIIPYREVPQNFKFPKEYLNLIKISDIESFAIKSVYFVSLTSCDYEDEKINRIYNQIKTKHSNIIPFAYGNEDSEIIVFDTNETNSNPKVFTIDCNTSTIKKEYISFKEWWNSLKENFMFEKKNNEK